MRIIRIAPSDDLGKCKKAHKKKRGHPLRKGKTQKKSLGVRTQKRKERGSRRGLPGEQVRIREKRGRSGKRAAPKGR